MPPDANDALLATVAASLAPSGIAYVSYNVQPGGYFRRMLRDAGLWHARGITAPSSSGRRRRRSSTASSRSGGRRPTTRTARCSSVKLPLVDGPLYSLVHDDLAEFWEPVWFAEFAAHAARHGLDYVGEADLFDFRSAALPEDISRGLAARRRGPGRIRNLYGPPHCAAFPQERAMPRGSRGIRQPGADRTARLHWAARPNADPPKVGLLAAALARLDRERSRTVAFDELRVDLHADPSALAEALLNGVRCECLIPHAGPLRRRRNRGPARWRHGWHAGRPRKAWPSRRWPTRRCASRSRRRAG